MSRKELIYITVNAVMLKMMMVYPRFIAENSGCAAWMTCIIATPAALALALCGGDFLCGGKCVPDLAGNGGVRIASGTLLTAALSANLINTACFFPISVKTVMLQFSDINLIIAALTAAVLTASYAGIKAAARIHTIFMPIAAAIIAAASLLLFKPANFNNITPLLGEGARKVFLDGLFFVSLFNDIIVLNVLASRCESKAEARSALFRGIIISGALAAAFMIMYAMVYPYPVVKNNILPMYSLSKNMRFGTYFGRFEALFEFIITLLFVLYACVYVNAIAETVQKTFCLKCRNIIITLTVAGLCVFLALADSEALLVKLSRRLYLAALGAWAALSAAYAVMKKAEKKRNR